MSDEPVTVTTTETKTEVTATPMPTATEAAASPESLRAEFDLRLAMLEAQLRAKKVSLIAKLKGYRTVIFATVVAAGPALLDYFKEIPWTTLGIAPVTALCLGAAVIALRALTTGPIGSDK